MARHLRKWQQAEDALRKLRAFYSEESDPYNKYSGERNTVNSRVLDKKTGKENPVKSLKQIRSHFSYDIKILLDRYDRFGSVHEYKTHKNEQSKDRSTMQARFRSDLETWISYAIPVLGRIITENPEAMEGFKYEVSHAQYGHDENEIEITNGEVQVIETGYEFGYAQSKAIRKKPFSRIALEIFNNITYPEDHVHGGYIHPGVFKLRDVSVEKLRKSIHKRNLLVREIERRTGRNLKEEVYESRGRFL